MTTDSDQRIADKIIQFVDLKGKRVLEVGIKSKSCCKFHLA